VEHVTENHGVPSSILGGRTISSFERVRRANQSRDQGSKRSGSLWTRLNGAGVAQLVEHFTRNEGVSGSIPLTSSSVTRCGPKPPPDGDPAEAAVFGPVCTKSVYQGVYPLEAGGQ